jgi:hypothetical protein
MATQIVVVGDDQSGTALPGDLHNFKCDKQGTDIYQEIVSGLVPHPYDYIELSYTGDNLTGVVYKLGGAAGTTVATLTLAYTGSRLDSVTKT